MFEVGVVLAAVPFLLATGIGAVAGFAILGAALFTGVVAIAVVNRVKS